MNSVPTRSAATLSENGAASPSSPRALFWMMVPLGLLVISVSGWLCMVSIAVDDPGFAVESDYYKKASNYDAEMAQSRENARLGLKAESLSFTWLPGGDARLTVRVNDASEKAAVGLRISAEAFPVARSNQGHELQFENVSPGIFVALISRARMGLWEVRLVMQTNEGDQATAVLRPELLALTGAKHGVVRD